MTRTVHVVLPGGVDDPASPSGGNRYDRRVCDELRARWNVLEIALPGTWPHPSNGVRSGLTGALNALPDGATVLLDGLVAGAAPEALEAVAGRLRLVVLVHLPLGDETGLDPAEAAALSALERRSLHAAAAVIATSEGAARRIRALHELPPDRVQVAIPGADPAPLAEPSPDGGRLLCVAAVTPRKGQDVLVQALELCTDLVWHCVCVGAWERAPDYVAALRASRVVSPVTLPTTEHSRASRPLPRGHGDPAVLGADPAARAGDSAQRTAGMEDAAEHPETDRRTVGAERGGSRVSTVEFVGTRAGAALDGSYAAADLLVLPSRAETYGMVVTEALARGVPVLGTRVDGVPEALGCAEDGSVPGTLVEPGDPAALAAAIRDWLTRPELRESWRAAARGRRTTLTGWDVTARRVSEVLQR